MIIRYRHGKETFSFLKENTEGIIVEDKTISFITTGTVFEVDASWFTSADVSFEAFPGFFENYSFIANVGCIDLGDVIRDYTELDSSSYPAE